MIGVFMLCGGGVHYLILYMNWKRHTEFIERYIKFARDTAWGGSLGVPEVDTAPAPAPAPAPGAAGAKLTISYQGETFPVTKDRFIIGRGKQSSDLTIKDPNVSRQHAMIEFSNGQYYIVDMGSTNGVEYNGQRVQRKVISEGDSFRVCDHELKFSFS